MSPAERAELRARLRTPVIVFATLLALLAVNVTLGLWLPFRGVWMVEAAVTTVMVLTVLLVSMEVIHEPPLMRLYAGLGFVYVAILFSMMMLDYLTR